MKKNSKCYVVGYDPGGDGNHGLAVLEIHKCQKKWVALSLHMALLETVADVIAELEQAIGKGKIIAAGIDTLTAWSMGSAGWRPADRRLRDHYKDVAISVDNPNHIHGSMCLNGAMILRWLRMRSDKGGKITETHPKVCFFALRHRASRHPWANVTEGDSRPAPADREQAKNWLLGIFDLPEPLPLEQFGDDDHRFDALMGCLAALKGLNNEWQTDLHDGADVIHPFGPTHYWWPENVPLPQD